jgi:hypothetical protein
VDFGDKLPLDNNEVVVKVQRAQCSGLFSLPDSARKIEPKRNRAVGFDSGCNRRRS